jgi:hypothetical protein
LPALPIVTPVTLRLIVAVAVAAVVAFPPEKPTVGVLV